MLDGSLKESRFAWPTEEEDNVEEAREMQKIGESVLSTNDVTYINGMHTLFLLFPPVDKLLNTYCYSYRIYLCIISIFFLIGRNQQELYNSYII